MATSSTAHNDALVDDSLIDEGIGGADVVEGVVIEETGPIQYSDDEDEGAEVDDLIYDDDPLLHSDYDDGVWERERGRE